MYAIQKSVVFWFFLIAVAVTTTTTTAERNVDNTLQQPQQQQSNTGSTTTSTLQHQRIGIIESCSGWALNKLPILKSFLKDGIAESYNNIYVQFIPNKVPTLILYESSSKKNEAQIMSNSDQIVDNIHNDNDNDDAVDDVDDIIKNFNMKEVERIPLSSYQSHDALHDLLQNRYNFTLKGIIEQQRIIEKAQIQQYNERLQKHVQIEYYRWRIIYVNEFRLHVMNMTEQEYQDMTKYQRLTCHPSGPIPDMLYENYDHINKKIAGAYKEDRYQYATRYLASLVPLLLEQ